MTPNKQTTLKDRLVIWIGKEAACMLWSAQAAVADGQEQLGMSLI